MKAQYFLVKQHLAGSSSGGSAATAVLLPGVQGSFCKLALSRPVDFYRGSASCTACTTMVGSSFDRVLTNKVIIHLWFDVKNSLRGEQLHEGLNSGGQPRGALFQSPPSDKTQMSNNVL